MKTKRIVCMMLTLLLVVSATMALGDRIDVQKEKLAAFCESLVELGLLPEGSAMPDGHVEEDGEMSYLFNDYLGVYASEDGNGWSTYVLFVLLADAPDAESMNAAYGPFVTAVMPGMAAEDADAMAIELVEGLETIDEYIAMSSADGEDYIVILVSGLTEAVMTLTVMLFS